MQNRLRHSGYGLGTALTMAGGVSWNQYWATQPKALFFAETSNIADGKLYNQKSGSTDYFTVAGVAGSYTFQCPDTAPYIAADTDFVWFREGDSSRRIATTEDLISFDFTRTIVKYLNVAPYTIEAIMILSSDVDTDKMRDDFSLSVWWDDTLSLHGNTKENRSTGRSVWNLGYTDETIAYIARVVADGGTISVTEQELTDADIRMLKTIDSFTDFTRILLPYGGKKIRTVGADDFITKWYDVKGASGDVTQATEALQPKYGTSQYNSIDIITCASSMMPLPSINIATLITVNNGTGYLFGTSGGTGYVRLQTTTTFLIKDDAGDAAAHTLIDKNLRIDSIIRSGGNANIWRNKTASVSNPVAKGNTTMDMLFQRLGSAYWVGTVAVFLLSTSAITTTKRALIEDYYIAKFAIT